MRSHMDCEARRLGGESNNTMGMSSASKMSVKTSMLGAGLVAVWRYDAAFSPVEPSFVYVILKLPTRRQFSTQHHQSRRAQTIVTLNPRLE